MDSISSLMTFVLLAHFCSQIAFKTFTTQWAMYSLYSNQGMNEIKLYDQILQNYQIDQFEQHHIRMSSMCHASCQD